MLRRSGAPAAGESDPAHRRVRPVAGASRIAGEVPDFDASQVLDRKEVRRNDRTTQFALVATRAALDMAGLPARLDEAEALDTAVVIGTGLGGTGTLIDQISTNASRGPDRLSPFFIPMAIGNMAAGQVAISFNAKGPNFSTTSACASAGHAIGEAAETILRAGTRPWPGRAAPRRSVCEATLGGFAAMRALSTRNDDPAAASRPFDRGRDGFVLAEGAGTVLEELGHARARARASSPSCAAMRPPRMRATSPRPRRVARALRAARRALQKAGIGTDEVDVVSAHATSTPAGDMEELAAIRSLLGERAPRVSLTATKSSIGHTLGAAGAIALVAMLMAMRDGTVPPTLNLTDPDPGVGDMDLTPLVARQRDVRVAIVNAFGFGGQNSAIVVRRWDER
ncbi:MAG: beta-ketoacyl synthase N-terminal-like domain-containing protein [Chloroflexota bacterium]